MKTIGFDPGKATGFCVVLQSKVKEPQVVSSGEIGFGKLSQETIERILKQNRPDNAVIEDVVKSGHLSKDKFIQICAFDRVRNMLDKHEIPYEIISPETRKRGKKQPPKSVTGQHAKDAYLIATSKMEAGTIEKDMDTEG